MTPDDRARLAYVFQWAQAEEARRRQRADTLRVAGAAATIAVSMAVLGLLWWLR